MTPNADLETLIAESIESAFEFYNEDIHKRGLSRWAAECVLKDLHAVGLMVSRNDSYLAGR